MKEQLIKAARMHAEGELERAKTNVMVYMKQSVGIGEHSDIVEAIQKELDTMAMATDRIEMLDKHFEYAKWEAKRYASFSIKSSSTLREKIKYHLINKFFFSYVYFFFQYFVLLGFLDGFEGYKYAKIKFKYFKKVYELLRK